MREAESTSEASVTFYQTTRRNIPKDSHLLQGLTFYSVLINVFEDKTDRMQEAVKVI
jgi:hypothetical protein